MKKNYYQILGLEEGASIEEVKTAYKQYAKKFHPDLQNGDEFFKERFQEILEAYEILVNQQVDSVDSKEESLPIIIYFTSSAQEIHQGENIKLEWNVRNATGVSLKIKTSHGKQENASISNKDSLIIYPKSEDGYMGITLEVTNNFGVIESDMLINIKPYKNELKESLPVKILVYTIIAMLFLAIITYVIEFLSN